MHSSLNKALSGAGGSGIPLLDNSARTLKKASGDYGLSPNSKHLESIKKPKKVSIYISKKFQKLPGIKTMSLYEKAPENQPGIFRRVIINKCKINSTNPY